MKSSLLAGYLFAAGASLAYAVGQVTTRMVVREIAPPLVIATFSILFGTFFLLLFFFPRLPQEAKGDNRRRGLLFFAAAGAVGGLAVTAMYTALRYSQVAVVSSLSAAHPLFALFFTHFFLQHLERVTPRIVAGTLLVVGGVVLVTLSQLYG